MLTLLCEWRFETGARDGGSGAKTTLMFGIILLYEKRQMSKVEEIESLQIDSKSEKKPNTALDHAEFQLRISKGTHRKVAKAGQTRRSRSRR